MANCCPVTSLKQFSPSVGPPEFDLTFEKVASAYPHHKLNERTCVFLLYYFSLQNAFFAAEHPTVLKPHMIFTDCPVTVTKGNKI